MKILLPIVAPMVALSALAVSGSAQSSYVLDDGTPNTGLSYQMAGDFGWFQTFQTVGSVDSITKVRLMLAPGALAVGTPLHICVWEDPNDDLDPYDAQLVTQLNTTVPVVPSLSYLDFPLPHSATVHGTFFIGAYLTTDGNDGTLALIDTNASVAHRAWFATSFPGGFDPNNMSGNNPNHIETLGSMFHGGFMIRAEGTGNAPTVYCTPKTNSVGCQPSISWLGTPSASAGSGFFLQATSEINRVSGMLLYTTAGRASTPFGGGTLCLAQPLRRTPLLNSGGTLQGVNCSGVYSMDFAAWIASGADPALVAGTTVQAQFYSRDPGFAAPNNIGLTAGLEFTLVP
jgi:hypothetical protein